MSVRITPESVAAAAEPADDMPPVLFVGSGRGTRRTALADGAVARFVAAVQARGAMVAFDKIAADPGAMDEAMAISGFKTAALLGRRQVCVLRRVDELPAAELVRLKHLATSTNQWWAMSAGSAGAIRNLTSFFLQVRATEDAATPDDALRMLAIHDVPRIRNVASVAPAVASGATLAELAEAFTRFATRRLPLQEAFELAARLDVDIRTNKRPLMLSALIEDAVREAEERQSPGS